MKRTAGKRATLPKSCDYTKAFLKDWERLSRSGRYDMNRLKEAMLLLIANDGPLGQEWRDHALKGEWNGYRGRLPPRLQARGDVKTYDRHLRPGGHARRPLQRVTGRCVSRGESPPIGENSDTSSVTLRGSLSRCGRAWRASRGGGCRRRGRGRR
ncbi:MAG: type II toxin-antitoxin system YafQ family toxin [Pararhizobium sp.]